MAVTVGSLFDARVVGDGVIREISAGLVGSLLSLAYCFSYAALIFAGPLEPFLANGVAAALMTGAVAAIVVALRSGFRVVVAGPVSHTAAPLAAMMAALAPTLSARPPGDALMLSLAALAATTLFTGAVLFALGWYRLGMLVRFVPYPVMTGFLAATGWLITVGAVRVTSGVPLTLSSLSSFAALQADLMLGITVLWAAALWMLTARHKHYLVLPAAVIGAMLATNLVLIVLGIPEETARAAGVMFEATPRGQPISLLLRGGFLHVDWFALMPILGNMATVAVMAVISVLLNSTGMELADRVEADFDRELKAHGVANIASALFGGFVGHLSVSNTMANRAAGGRGRLSGVVVGVVALAALAGGSQIFNYVPRFVLCGLLLQLGLRLLWDWGWVSRNQLPRRDWLVVAAIVLITAVFGFLQGVAFGLIASCFIFALDVSRIGVVRRQFGLDERPSMVVRSLTDTHILAADGGKVQTLELCGFIFFGSAYRLQQYIKGLVAEKAPDILIFDFTAVTGVDSSAGESFSNLRAYLQRERVREVFVKLPSHMENAVNNANKAQEKPNCFETLDEALEWCEELLLAKYPQRARVDDELLAWLSDALDNAYHARALIAYLERATTFDGNCLCKQGDPTDTLFFVERGRVGVTVERADQTPVRVRVFGPHTLVGEIGFFLHIPRTATVRIDGEATVWALHQEGYRRLKESHPGVVVALLTYVVQLETERLTFTTRQIAAL